MPAQGGEGWRIPRSGTDHRMYKGRVRSDPRAPVPQPGRSLYSVMLWRGGQPPGGESAVASDETPLTDISRTEMRLRRADRPNTH